MQVKHWGFRLMLGLVLFAGVLSCRLSDTLLAQAQPTITPTRTPRPTFTPLPPPSPIVPPTVVTTPSKTPTRSATAKPAPTRTSTKAPAPPAPPPPSGPTKSPYEFHAMPPTCEHAGGVYLKAVVYGDRNDPNSGLEGVLVVLGDGNGNRFDVPPYTTTYDGTYSFTLSADGAPPWIGTIYIWLIDSGGRRISDIGGPININGKKETAPDACWHGMVNFVR